MYPCDSKAAIKTTLAKLPGPSECCAVGRQNAGQSEPPSAEAYFCLKFLVNLFQHKSDINASLQQQGS